MAESAVAYLLLFTSLVLVARPVSTFIDHFITAWRASCCRSFSDSGRIRLASDDDGPQKRPFPRRGLIPVAILSLAGIAIQIIIVAAGARRSWYSACLSFWFTQVVYFISYFVLLFLAVTYPYHLLVTTTFSIPLSRPTISVKRTRIFTNPGATVQQIAFILALLPLLASLEPYGWYNRYYWRRYRFSSAEIITIIQPVLAAVIFLYGTYVRQVYGDGEERQPETGYASATRAEEGRVAPPSAEEHEPLLEGSDIDALEIIEPVTPPPATPKAPGSATA